MDSSQVLTTQIERSSERYGSIEYVLKGDVKNAQADERVERRIPRLIEKFKESPIIGWGFSDESLGFADGHVGFHNMLREGGILEMIIFVFLFFQISSKLWNMSKRRGVFSNERNSLKYASFAFLSLMITHGATSQLFGYFLGFNALEKWFMVSLILVGFNVFYQQINRDISDRLY